ncbi:hypothetical protein, partial [Isoptericola variabilis]|uniref:hypothetical protein n=1 Tax=Isoptericola variabilis TaxID=139208 RepID=UPI0019553484
LQRFQTLLKLHPIELHATFLEESPAATHRHRDQAPSPSHHARHCFTHPQFRMQFPRDYFKP